MASNLNIYIARILIQCGYIAVYHIKYCQNKKEIGSHGGLVSMSICPIFNRVLHFLYLLVWNCVSFLWPVFFVHACDALCNTFFSLFACIICEILAYFILFLLQYHTTCFVFAPISHMRYSLIGLCIRYTPEKWFMH